MDTPATEPSTAPLSTDQAAGAFAALLDPPEPDKVEKTEETPVVEATPEAEAAPEAEVEEGAIEVEVDGKPVTLTKAQIAEAYKNGLRQADYTKKTMEAAEQRKSAEAETAKAQMERQQYAHQLQMNSLQLQAAVDEYKNVDWEKLFLDDPAAAGLHKHRFDSRQAALQDHQRQLHQLAQQTAAEQAKVQQKNALEQREALLAKLPEWKDAAKAKADKDAIVEYLKKEGFGDEDLGNINDHRAVLMARKAYLYDQMVEKAKAATKKVSALPQKVERPGAGEAPSLDRRNAAFQKLSKSGRVEDAAAAFATFI